MIYFSLKNDNFMLLNKLSEKIDQYLDFPTKNILFRDVMPILQEPELFSDLIKNMALSSIVKECDAIIAIDARGFIFGAAIALIAKKPMIVARKAGKLPGNLISEKYDLEYGSNELTIQKEALKPFKKLAIIDDLLATGGTVKCVENMVHREGKSINGLLVVIELEELLAKSKFQFPVESVIKF